MYISLLWHDRSPLSDMQYTQNSDKPARWYNTMGRDSVLYYTRNVSRLSLWIYTAWVVMRDLALRRTNRIKPYLQGVRRGLSADSR